MSSYSTIISPPPGGNQSSLLPPSSSSSSSPKSDLERTPLLHHSQKNDDGTPSNPHHRSKSPSPSPSSRSSSSGIPSTTRFLADFTLGFADGLTVPFALTAGLSSLGKTDTVIYAGMAEICAGSISMGIGGYLSAKGEYNLFLQEQDQQTRKEDGVMMSDDEETVTGVVEQYEREEQQEQQLTDSKVLEKYLAPLGLEEEHHEDEEVRKVLEGWIRRRPEVIKDIRKKIMMMQVEAARKDESDEASAGSVVNDLRVTTTTTATATTRAAPSPILVGVSVSLGYLLGGLLPLFPYFFVGEVGEGLKWSFAVCLVALFGFGFLKDFFLNRQEQQQQQQHKAGQDALWGKDKLRAQKRVSWRDVRRSAWEGTQMALMGGVAAVAAVLCVKAFEGLGV